MKIQQLISTTRGLGLAALLGAAQALAQNYSVGWHSIDGGGNTSTGGAYAISGTIGQPDAGKMSGGGYALDGGFWSILLKDGPPSLRIRQQAGQLVLSWPADATGVVVQSATQLAPGSADWSNLAGNPVRVGDEFELNIGPALTPPSPIRFFRLYRP
jgi:hypothetical protein